MAQLKLLAHFPSTGVFLFFSFFAQTAIFDMGGVTGTSFLFGTRAPSLGHVATFGPLAELHRAIQYAR